MRGSVDLESVATVDAFLALCGPLFAAHASELGISLAIDRDWAASLPERQLVVVRHGDEPAGYLVMHGEANPVTGARCCIIDAIFVRREHRRRGFGDALLARARCAARNGGYSHLVCAAPAGGRLRRVLGRTWTMTEVVFEVRIDGH
jgi:GNAT superfamily N-acetyltransferase